MVTRLERFGSIDSTQAIVRAWLDDGADEVCLAVADEQLRGRGRLDRTWQAPPGRGLLVSAGFRPPALALAQAWRLPAVASMAMLAAVTSLLGPTKDRFALKWPNDLVAVHHGRIRKVGGVLAEVATAGEQAEHIVVGIGVNVDWPAAQFPAGLGDAMWSLSEASGRRRIDREALLASWLERLGPAYESLRAGSFDGSRWADAQVTTGAEVVVETGADTVTGVAVGMDQLSGALLVRIGPGIPLRVIAYGDVVRCSVDEAGQT